MDVKAEGQETGDVLLLCCWLCCCCCCCRLCRGLDVLRLRLGGGCDRLLGRHGLAHGARFRWRDRQPARGAGLLTEPSRAPHPGHQQHALRCQGSLRTHRVQLRSPRPPTTCPCPDTCTHQACSNRRLLSLRQLGQGGQHRCRRSQHSLSPPVRPFRRQSTSVECEETAFSVRTCSCQRVRTSSEHQDGGLRTRPSYRHCVATL
jgi:hypothetical protein